MATLDDDLANAVTEGFRQAQIDIVNQDKFLSGTGDVEIVLADGTKKTVPTLSKLITAATTAGTSAAAAATSATNAKTSETNANTSKNAAASSASAADTSKTNAKTSETNAKTSETNAKTSENNAKTSETNAAASLAAAQQLTSVPYEAAPFPDVWAPLNDDLRLLAGFAPYDRLTISGQVLELPSKSLSFARASTATYIDKSGVLRTAAINEPRFEREGLLIEGQSTNLAIYSSPTTNTSSYFRSGANQSVSFRSTGGVELTPTSSTGTWWEQNINTTTFDPTKPASISVYLEFPADAKVRVMLMRFSTEGDIASASVTATQGINKLSVPALGGGINQRVGIRITVDSGTPANSLIFIDRMQIEETFVSTSYIPTNGAAVTRAADDCTLQRSGNDNWWGPTTISLEVHCNGTTVNDGNVESRRGILSYYPSSTEFSLLVIDSSASNYGKCLFAHGPYITLSADKRVDDGYVHRITSVTDTTINKIFTDSATDGKSLAISRPVPGTVSSTSINIYFGRNVATLGRRMLNGHIRNLRIWHRALTDNQIRGLR